MSHRAEFLVPASASESDARLLGRAERDTVQPVRQQVGIADRAGLACQNEEDSLKGVFGVVQVAQELAADVQDHRPVPTHQRGEGRLAGGIARLVNRSMSWRSVNPATEPPSKSDPICRTTDWFLTGDMPQGPVAATIGATGARESFVPPAIYCLDAELLLPSCAQNSGAGTEAQI